MVDFHSPGHILSSVQCIQYILYVLLEFVNPICFHYAGIICLPITIIITLVYLAKMLILVKHVPCNRAYLVMI